MGLRTLLHTAGHWLKGQLLKVDEEIQFDNTVNPEMDSSGGSFIQIIKDADANAYTLKDSGGVDIWKVDTVAQTVTVLSPYVLGNLSTAISGTTDTFPIFTSANSIGDSNLTMIGLGDNILQWEASGAQLSLKDGSKFLSSYISGVSGGAIDYSNGTNSGSLKIDDAVSLTASRTWNMPDASGTIALTTNVPVQATETVAGIAEIATQVETDTGTDDTRFVTPLKLETRLTNLSGSFATTLSSWTLDAGNVYYADAIHNFGTDDVLVEVYDSVTKETVLVEKIDRIDTNTVRIFIDGNTASLRVVVTQSSPVYQGVSGRNVVKNPVTPYVAQNNDIIIWDATSGNKVVDLPIAGSSNNFRIDIKKIDGTANTVTIDPNGAELIDGGSNAILTLQYEAISIVCDGGEWHILASL